MSFDVTERAGFSISDSFAGDDTTIVDVAGEIDMETGPAFQEGLLHALGASRGGLIVDLVACHVPRLTALTSLVNAFD